MRPGWLKVPGRVNLLLALTRQHRGCLIVLCSVLVDRSLAKRIEWLSFSTLRTPYTARAVDSFHLDHEFVSFSDIVVRASIAHFQEAGEASEAIGVEHDLQANK